MSTEIKNINCLNIAYIFKTSLGSINGSWTEGNVSTVKKITLPNGNLLPYVSGQSVKYQIRKAWREMGLEAVLSEVKQAEKAAGVNFTAGEPDKYLDDDLLGFMIASTGENRRRTAVARTSAAIGMFPYKGDRDLGTKSKELSGGDMGAGGNIFETEIYYNYFKVNILIELDRLGNFQPFELAKGVKTVPLTIIDRKARLINFLSALTHIWGGGKQSRLLTDMSPKFLAITFQNKKAPLFLETLSMDNDENLNTDAIKEVLADHKNVITNQFLGVQSGIFKNNVAIDLGKDNTTTSIQTAFNAAIEFINKPEFKF
jgi:CRISPR-associated protein Cst2